MQFEISSPGKLRGTVLLPGDRAITLSLLAFGMLTGKKVVVQNPSPSPDTEILIRFFRDSGVECIGAPDMITLRGDRTRETIRISGAVPEEIFHIVAAGAAFGRSRVIIENPEGKRNNLLQMLFPALQKVGLRDENILTEGNTLVISGAGFSVSGKIFLNSAWEFEAAAAASIAAQKPLTATGNRQEFSSALSILQLLGLQPSEAGDTPADPLLKRLSRISGEKPSGIFRLEWDHKDCEASVPGDTVLAAALAGAAAVLPHSDILLRGALWDMGRRGFFEALRRMKARVEWTPGKGFSWDSADIRVKGSVLEGIQITAAQARTMRSELLLLGTVAAFARGETIVRNAEPGPVFSRDILQIFTAGLEMLGAYIGDYPDGIVVKGGHELKGNLTDSGGFQEIALPFALAGTVSSGITVVFGWNERCYPVSEYIRLIKGLSDASPLFDPAREQ